MDRTTTTPPLPFEPLPYDDEADRPIGLALTARGRRMVAPEDLPDLQVVAAPTDPAPDPSDTRPSRARALRRAGRSFPEIAAHLDVDELLVRAWVADVGPSGRRARAHVTAAPAATEDDAGVDDHHTAFQLARAAARDDLAADRLADPAFVGGLGLVAGIVEVDAHAVTLVSGDPALVATALGWLRRWLDVAPERIRAVLRIGPRVAGDLAAHRWAKQLGLPRERVAVTSWRQAPADDTEQVLLRLADPAAAATLAGWRDAFLDPPAQDPADLAF